MKDILNIYTELRYNPLRLSHQIKIKSFKYYKYELTKLKSIFNL